MDEGSQGDWVLLIDMYSIQLAVVHTPNLDVAIGEWAGACDGHHVMGVNAHTASGHLQWLGFMPAKVCRTGSW